MNPAAVSAFNYAGDTLLLRKNRIKRRRTAANRFAAAAQGRRQAGHSVSNVNVIVSSSTPLDVWSTFERRQQPGELAASPVSPPIHGSWEYCVPAFWPTRAE